jgi:hypothetical protein
MLTLDIMASPFASTTFEFILSSILSAILSIIGDLLRVFFAY